MKFTTTAVLVAAAAAGVAADAVAPWIITSLSSGERDNLCQRQIQTCQNNCGGPDKAPMAFCNSKTMAWGCGCKEKTPDFQTWDWPVPAADCGGSAATCKSNCNAASGDRNQCFINCSNTHKCNTEDAPVSYTSTSDIDTAPKYVGPAVSYNGKQLGDLNDGNDRSKLDSSNSDSESDGESGADKAVTSGAAAALKTTVLAAAAAVAAAFAF
ncbi:hypothetical protein LPJ61_001503 [Coemansia biformis]|uniref:DUF7707 domain-containing protein n=1 Tax=Coemansia biformis TaxID=1286918 RepID=A0A9W8CX86_9FUNG|nr:hypothetical protein LPJ61_001503 [Coemansia biformis]